MAAPWASRPVLVLGGPNLGRLGLREPEFYGAATHDDLRECCEQAGTRLGFEVSVRQTDVEAEMLGWLHQGADDGNAVVLNAAAWTHTSVAVRDAAAMLRAPLVEVHVSNIFAREPFRRHSYLSDIAAGVISGLGIFGYDAALSWLAQQRDEAASSTS